MKSVKTHVEVTFENKAAECIDRDVLGACGGREHTYNGTDLDRVQAVMMIECQRCSQKGDSGREGWDDEGEMACHYARLQGTNSSVIEASLVLLKAIVATLTIAL